MGITLGIQVICREKDLEYLEIMKVVYMNANGKTTKSREYVKQLMMMGIIMKVLIDLIFLDNMGLFTANQIGNMKENLNKASSMAKQNISKMLKYKSMAFGKKGNCMDLPVRFILLAHNLRENGLMIKLKGKGLRTILMAKRELAFLKTD